MLYSYWPQEAYFENTLVVAVGVTRPFFGMRQRGTINRTTPQWFNFSNSVCSIVGFLANFNKTRINVIAYCFRCANTIIIASYHYFHSYFNLVSSMIRCQQVTLSSPFVFLLNKACNRKFAFDSSLCVTVTNLNAL